MEKNLIYIDEKNIKWTIGCPKIGKPANKSKIVWLPITMKSMHPVEEIDPDLDYIYCSCIQCNSFIDSGVVCIEFRGLNWGIRLLCSSCYPGKITQSCEKLLIVEIFNLISKRFTYGCETNSKQCLVCEKPNCLSIDCKASINKLYNNDTEILLEHFYRIKLDILSLFWNNEICHVCLLKKGTRCCNYCKLKVYCCKKCKKLDLGHPCENYWEIWRNILE